MRLASVRPSAFPGQATKRVSSALLRPWRAWPPYCSSSCWCVAPGGGPWGVVVRRLRFACLVRSLWEQAVMARRRVAFTAPRSSLGKGGRPPCPLGGGGGAPPPRPAGRRGGVGGEGRGGCAVVPLLPPPGGCPVAPCPDPPSSPAHSPRVCLSGRGCGAAPGARRGLLPAGEPGGGRGGGCVLSSPEVRPGGLAGRGVALPLSVPLPSLGRRQSGCHWRRSGYGGRGPDTGLVLVHVLCPGVTRAPSSCACAGSLGIAALVGVGGRGRGGAWRAGSAAPPPRALWPFLREGGRPLRPGGVEGRCPRGPPAGGRSGGRGEGGSRRGSPPPFSGRAACGPRLSPPLSPAHCPPVHLSGRGRWAATGPGRGLAGRRWVSLAGRGGGGRPVSRPPPRGLDRGLFPLHIAFWGAALPPRSMGRP